jgi:hypothetical protein
MAFSAIINFAGLAVGAITLADSLTHKAKDPNKQTTVIISLGDAPNSGGSIPHIAAWDANGVRIGQFKGDANGHMDDSTQESFVFDNKENGEQPAQPEYVSVVMQEGDALCISMITAIGDGSTWTWTGDMAYSCQAQWYYSSRSYGNSDQPIKCTYIDSDHTNGIIAKAISLHMPDFSGDTGLISQYNEKPERLCASSARMTFHPDPFLPDSIPAFFDPPLQYGPSTLSDGTNITTGLIMPDQGVDKQTWAYPDGTALSYDQPKVFPRGAPVRRHARDVKSGKKHSSKKHKNIRPDHVVISNMKGHSAQELCEHPTSLGPDFVSTVEGMFCDMETGIVWPLCSSLVGARCFDLEIRQMRGGNGTALLHPSLHPIPSKAYKTHRVWE